MEEKYHHEEKASDRGVSTPSSLEAPAPLDVAPDAHKYDDTAQDPDLPPQDRGWRAWVNLAALSCMLMVTWGFVSAFGVFRQWYFNNPPFQGNQLITEIGVLSVGILQMLTPFLLRFLTGRAHLRKTCMAVGGVLVVAGSIGAAFAPSAGALIALLGAVYGIGSGLLFAPSISYIDEWFLKRRGLANGIYFGSNNISAAWWSPVFSALLERFGPRPVLIAWGIFAGAVIALAILCVSSRVPVAKQSARQQPLRWNGLWRRQQQDQSASVADVRKTAVSWAPFRRPLFMLVAVAIFLQGLGNMLPATYLPTYATDLGISATQASVLLTVLNIFGMIGQVAFGFLIDAVGILIPLLLSTLVSAFATLVIWGIWGQYYGALIAFAILFGAFSFSFIVLRSHFAADIVASSHHRQLQKQGTLGDEGVNNGKASVDRAEEVTVVSGALMAVRGVACIISGFIGDGVASDGAPLGVQRGQYGAGMWRAVILAIGCLMLGATIGAVGFLRKRRA